MKATYKRLDPSRGFHTHGIEIEHDGRQLTPIVGTENACKAFCSVINSILAEDRDSEARAIRTMFSFMSPTDQTLYAPDAINGDQPLNI